MSGYYIGIFKGENLVGITIVQRVQMYADDIFRKSSRNILKQFAKQLVSKIVKMSMDVIVPDSPRDENGNVIDSNALNFADSVSLYTPQKYKVPTSL